MGSAAVASSSASKGLQGFWMPGDGCACIKDMLACLPILLFSSSVLVAAHSPQACSAPDNMSLEQTFIMIKPDGVARGLVGEVIKRFEQKVGLSKSPDAQICEMPAVCGNPLRYVQDSLCRLRLGVSRQQHAAKAVTSWRSTYRYCQWVRRRATTYAR